MRWSIVRLIWNRELRDQLRDRRTILMIVLLPVLLYPLGGLGLLQLVSGYISQSDIVGIVGAEQLHTWPETPPRPHAQSVVAWLACTPSPPGGFAIDRITSAMIFPRVQPRPDRVATSLSWLLLTPPLPGCPGLMVDRLSAAMVAEMVCPSLDYPPFLVEIEGNLRFSPDYLSSSRRPRPSLVPLLIPGELPTLTADLRDPEQPLMRPYHALLAQRQIDVLLVVAPDFRERLFRDEQGEIFLFGRNNDEISRATTIRVDTLVQRWKNDLLSSRLARMQLPSNLAEPINLYDPERSKPIGQRAEENLANVLVRIFPFILVMWSLAGALYPAVDLCAGEKERGTMETLLISPASREEIVLGKFLTIWLFSAATALVNFFGLAISIAIIGSSALSKTSAVPVSVLLWGVVLLLPLSAFFSAMALAIGAFARSSKEGQYYLMPLFVVTMPLIMLTLAPGIELSPMTSLIPVTGVALLLQRLVAPNGSSAGDAFVWLYFVPVLLPMVVYSWLALRWAAAQFHSEEVLFREADRFDFSLWLQRLLSEKEALPRMSEIVFCFGLILTMRWISLGLGGDWSLLVRLGVGQLAFVLAPVLIMATLLTTRPFFALGLRWPPWWSIFLAVVLTIVLLPPMAELSLFLMQQFPALRGLLELNHPLTGELRAISTLDAHRSRLQYFLFLAILPAVCEELAFRGWLLRGLVCRVGPIWAIVASAFLYSLYQLNVFQFLPHFLFGIVLGIITLRTGSVLPAMLVHGGYNALFISPLIVPGMFGFVLRFAPSQEVSLPLVGLRLLLSGSCAVLAVLILGILWRAGPKSELEMNNEPSRAM
jgi:sodium transport system permease protein